MNHKQIIRLIEAQGNEVNSKIIQDLIHEHESAKNRQIRDYENYQGDELPIDSRVFDDSTKINRKVANDFRGEIVDQSVGYLFGKEITYSLDKEVYTNEVNGEKKLNESAFKRDNDALRDFIITNNLPNLDLEAGKRQGICGTTGRILYIDKEGALRVMNVPPWEMIYIYDRSLDKMQYALRYYLMKDVVDGKATDVIRVEWYDADKITFYIQKPGFGFVLDDTEPVNPLPHIFGRVPVVEIPNNDERMSDFKKVASLIDSYDRTLSDAQNEIEEFRQAYMMFIGAMIDEATRLAARQSGAFNLPEEADVRYLTKQINDTFLENHKETLRDNIYRFSKTIDINSDTFTGQGASGEARKWILTALEWRCGIKALKFAHALDKMFQICQSVWETRGLTLDWKNISYEFDRNIPQELKLEAEILEKLDGHLSKRTALKIFSPVSDVDAELEAIKQEREGSVNLDDIEDDEDEE